MLEHYIVLVALGAGTYFDVFNKKMVPDLIWIIGAGIGVLLVIQDAIYDFTNFSILPELIEVAVVFALCRFVVNRGYWGGADAQALVMMTILLPFGQSMLMLSNAFLFAMVVPVYLIAKREKDWGSYPLPFILFMYLGALSYVVWGSWVLSI
jgi:hypothetical protein